MVMFLSPPPPTFFFFWCKLSEMRICFASLPSMARGAVGLPIRGKSDQNITPVKGFSFGGKKIRRIQRKEAAWGVGLQGGLAK